jgi:uncharacterized protein (TIGR04255 family)
MKTDFPHLARAPIREALLDIKVEPRPDFTADQAASFAEKVKAEFPNPKPLRSVQAELDLGDEQLGVRSGPPLTLGTICWNESMTRAVQARLDGFTVNHVQGYESWGVLRDQARRLWGQYLATAAPSRVLRCTLRYINRLEFPVGVDIGERLLTRPEIGPELPQLIDDCFMRVVLAFPNGRKASVTQATEPVVDRTVSVRGLILDIDAFSTRAFNIGDDAMWEEFDELRAVKNMCFFKSLKNAAWEVYR